MSEQLMTVLLAPHVSEKSARVADAIANTYSRSPPTRQAEHRRRLS